MQSDIIASLPAVNLNKGVSCMATTKELLAPLRLLSAVPTEDKKKLLSFLLVLRDTGDTVTPPVSCFLKEKE